MADRSLDRALLLNQLADEFGARYRRGERPPLREYLDKYPELADDIRDLFPTVVEMERAKDDRQELFVAQPAAETPRLVQLGDFRILREIGRGAMGVVYEAEQVSLGRHVALKALSQKVLVEARHKARFEREARAAAKLHHTHIVPVYGVGEHDGLPYYVMQIIQGLGLDEVIEELRRIQTGDAVGTGGLSGRNPVSPRNRVSNRWRPDASAADVALSLLTGEFASPTHVEVNVPPVAASGPPAGGPADTSALSSSSVLSSVVLPGQEDSAPERRPRKTTYWQSVAQIGAQVAEALDYAHQQGVLHRDIKPSNLLLDTQGAVWVTDFGLAKADDQQNLTQTGDIVGTLRYMPPEAFDGTSDARSDVYSLGLTLYEMLALRPAFEERDRNRLIKQKTTADPAPLDRLKRAIPRDLVTVVHKAIDRDPAQRYATAGELAADLHRFCADESIQARRPSGMERLRRWARHHPGLASSLAALGLLLVVVAAGSMVAAERFRRIAAEKDDERKKAVAAQEQAEQAGTEVRRRSDAQRWESYRSDVIAALSALQLNNFTTMRRALEAAPPEHRNWEWRYLDSQLEGARFVIAPPGWPGREDSDAPAGASQTQPQPPQMVLSPAGRQVAVCWADSKVVELWDVSTGTKTADLRGHEGPVRLLEYSPEGKRLASGATDRTIRVWNLATHQPDAVLREHEDAVAWFKFGPDGRRIVSRDDRSFRLWDVTTGKQIAVLGGLSQTGVASFSPDGQRVVTGGSEKAYLWNAATGKQIAVMPGHQNPVYEVLFSPDGQRIVSRGSFESDIHLFNGVTGQEVAVLGHIGAAPWRAFSPDSSRLITGNGDPPYTLHLWETATGRLIADIPGHKNVVYSVCFSPDGRRLVSASQDQTVRLWDGVTGRSIAVVRGHTGWVRGAFYSPDGRRVVSFSDDHTLRLWDAETGELDAVLRGHGANVNAAAFTADGAFLVSSSSDGTLRVWDAQQAGRNGVLRGHTSYVYDVAFSPDGTTVASAAWDNTVRLWDAASGRQTGLLKHAANIVPSVAFHPDGKQLASLSRDDKVYLWDLTTGQPRHVLAAPTGDWTGDVRAVFNPAGTLLATGSRDGRIHVWDVDTCRPVGALQGHEALVRDVAFSPDGKQLASAGYDGTVRLWNTASLVPKLEFGNEIAVLRGHQERVYGLAYSTDGRLLASCGTDKTVRLWDTGTHRELAALQHGSMVYGVAFSPDGTRLAAGCGDNTIRLWDVATRQEVAELRGHEAYVHCVAFSPDGTRLVSGSGDYTVRVWDSLPPVVRARPAANVSRPLSEKALPQ